MFRRAAREYASSFAGLPAAVWVLALVALINRAGSMVLPFLSIYVTSERGYPPAAAGDCFTAYGVGALLGTLLGGWLADRIDGRLIMVATLFANGLGFLVLGQARELVHLQLVLFLTGLATDAFRPVNGAMLARVVTPELRGRAFALHLLGVNMGMSIGPAVGGVLAEIDYAALFVVDGVTCWLAALAVVVARGHLPVGAARERDGALPTRSPLTDVPFLTMIVGAFAVGCLFFQFFSTWTLFLHRDYGYSEAQVGALITVNTLLITVAQMPMSAWVGRLRATTAMALGACMIGASFAMLPYGSSFGYAVSAMVAFTIGEMVYSPTVTAHTTRSAPPGAVGRYFGVYSFAMAGAGMVAPAIGMRVYSRVGGEALWLGCGALGVAAGAVFALAALLRAPTKGDTPVG